MNEHSSRPDPSAARSSILGRLRDLLPWPSRPGRDVRAAVVRAQVDVIRRAFGSDVAAAPSAGVSPVRDVAEAAYLYRPGVGLVRETDVDRLSRYFEERDGVYRGSIDRVGRTPTPGLALVALPKRRDGRDPVLATLEEVDQDLGRGVVTPDHVLYVTAKGYYCPATEPEEPSGRVGIPFPRPSDAARAGGGVSVSVVDTGLWKGAAANKKTPWMHDVVADAVDLEAIDPTDIHPYGGHGTFVAGIVKCLAPGTRVEVEGALTKGGAAYESDIVAQLDQALSEGDHPQLISISAGSHTRNGFALLSFEMLASTYGLDDGEQTLIIAAAGNDGSKEPFWPAAFPWVAAVGSVDPDGKVSDFSNHGPWVDVFARGRDLVNAFPKGVYTCYEPPNVGQVRTFDGLAQWSGTSFSTPIVTGLVAARMSATGESALKAFQAVVGAGTAPSDPKAGSAPTVGPLS